MFKKVLSAAAVAGLLVSLAPSAYAGADKLQAMAAACGISSNMRRHGIEPSAIPGMARSAMTVTRLLKNNPRDITEADCVEIYSRCFKAVPA